MATVAAEGRRRLFRGKSGADDLAKSKLDFGVGLGSSDKRSAKQFDRNIESRVNCDGPWDL